MAFTIWEEIENIEKKTDKHDLPLMTHSDRNYWQLSEQSPAQVGVPASRAQPEGLFDARISQEFSLSLKLI